MYAKMVLRNYENFLALNDVESPVFSHFFVLILGLG